MAKHIPDIKKTEAVAYVLAGLNQTKAAILAKVNAKSLSRWCSYEPQVIAKASKLLARAKKDALLQRKIASGEIIQRGSRTYSPKSFAELQRRGRELGTRNNRV